MEITEPRNFFLIVGCVIAALIIVRDESEEKPSSRPTPAAIVATEPEPEPAFTKAEFDQAVQKYLPNSMSNKWHEVEVSTADANSKMISLQIWYAQAPEIYGPVAVDTQAVIEAAIETLASEFAIDAVTQNYYIVCRGVKQRGRVKEYIGKSEYSYLDDSIQFSKTTSMWNL